LIVSFYAFPFGFFVQSLLWMRNGYKAMKTGYAPPLDSVLYNDRIAIKTRFSKLKAVTLLIPPLIILIGMYYLHTSFVDIVDNSLMDNFQKKYEQKCTVIQKKPIKNPLPAF